MQAIDSSVLFCPAAFDELYIVLLLPEAGNDCIACSMQRCFQETFFLEMIEKAFFLIIAFYYIVVCVNVIETT